MTGCEMLPHAVCLDNVSGSHPREIDVDTWAARREWVLCDVPLDFLLRSHSRQIVVQGGMSDHELFPSCDHLGSFSGSYSRWASLEHALLGCCQSLLGVALVLALLDPHVRVIDAGLGMIGPESLLSVVSPGDFPDSKSAKIDVDIGMRGYGPCRCSAPVLYHFHPRQVESESQSSDELHRTVFGIRSEPVKHARGLFKPVNMWGRVIGGLCHGCRFAYFRSRP